MNGILKRGLLWYRKAKRHKTPRWRGKAAVRLPRAASLPSPD